MNCADLRRLTDENVTLPFLTVVEAAGYSETAARKALRRGELPFRVLAIGNRLRVPSCDVVAMLLTPQSKGDATADTPTPAAAARVGPFRAAAAADNPSVGPVCPIADGAAAGSPGAVR